MKIRRRNGWIRSSTWLPLLLVLFSFSIAQTLEAQTPGASGTARPYDEAEAQAIDRQIMCPVCPAESIDQAQVLVARQMRQMVRHQLSQGASQAEILEFFAQRYGTDILASPPKSGFNLLAWVFPVISMAAALIAGWLIIRSMVARHLVNLDSAASLQPDLKPFLALVDADIGLEQPTPTSYEGQPHVDPQPKELQREGGLHNGG